MALATTPCLAGGAGDDFIGDGPFEESQRDVLAGSAGNDELGADNTPASREIVSCGSGRDSAEVDRKDIVGEDCERVLLLVFFEVRLAGGPTFRARA